MKQKSEIIRCLKITPIIQIACQKAGIGRATYYRWRKEDKKFKRKSDIAKKNGISFINDLAESFLISKIKEGNMTAIIYWLKHHSPDYRENNLVVSSFSKISKVPYIQFVNAEDPKPGDKMIS